MKYMNSMNSILYVTQEIKGKEEFPLKAQKVFTQTLYLGKILCYWYFTQVFAMWLLYISLIVFVFLSYNPFSSLGHYMSPCIKLHAYRRYITVHKDSP